MAERVIREIHIIVGVRRVLLVLRENGSYDYEEA
jgi:hypothetical protein